MSVRTVVLDTEAVDVLRNPRSHKHPALIRQLQGAIGRKLRGHALDVLIPTAVRVEANWDLQQPDQAFINRFPAKDVSLDREMADVASRIHGHVRVSVADAHLGAVVDEAVVPVAVITSDVDDVNRMASFLGVKVTISKI